MRVPDCMVKPAGFSSSIVQPNFRDRAPFSNGGRICGFYCVLRVGKKQVVVPPIRRYLLLDGFRKCGHTRHNAEG